MQVLLRVDHNLHIKIPAPVSCFCWNGSTNTFGPSFQPPWAGSPSWRLPAAIRRYRGPTSDGVGLGDAGSVAFPRAFSACLLMPLPQRELRKQQAEQWWACWCATALEVCL